MKKLSSFFLLISVTAGMTSCYRVQPNPGEESVLVYKPFIFGHGGVDDVPVSTGATWCVFTTEHKEFPITPITITEDFTNMIPSDNTPVSFSVYLKCQVQKGKTPQLYKDFSADWYEHSLQASFRTMVRDKASAFKMFDLASKREISAQLEKDIYKDILEYATKLHLPVDLLQVSIGAITPPEQVLTETKNTAAQNQSILTQSARANAELARKQAEINKAIADQAYKNQMGMTVSEYLQLRHLEIEKEKVELIKDNKNISIIFGNASPVLPIK
ncbi:MAG: SPFH domain-containing protein [bacterium]|nr:SPFH domain-containing protein [bacterium]